MLAMSSSASVNVTRPTSVASMQSPFSRRDRYLNELEPPSSSFEWMALIVVPGTVGSSHVFGLVVRVALVGLVGLVGLAGGGGGGGGGGGRGAGGRGGGGGGGWRARWGPPRRAA